MPNILAVSQNVDVTAWYDRGVLEVSAPVRAVKPEGTRIPVQDADATPGQLPDPPDEEPARPGRGVISHWTCQLRVTGDMCAFAGKPICLRSLR